MEFVRTIDAKFEKYDVEGEALVVLAGGKHTCSIHDVYTDWLVPVLRFMALDN